MKLLIQKSVCDEIMKSYIARWGYPGHYRYKYLQPDKGDNSHGYSTEDKTSSSKAKLKKLEFFDENDHKIVMSNVEVPKDVADRYNKGEFGYKFKPGLATVTALRKDAGKHTKAIKDNETVIPNINFNYSDKNVFHGQMKKLFNSVQTYLARNKVKCPAIKNMGVVVNPGLSLGHLESHEYVIQEERAKFIHFIPEIITNGKLVASQLIIDKNGKPQVRHDLTGSCKVDGKFYAVTLILQEGEDNLLHITLFESEIQKSISMSASVGTLDTLTKKAVLVSGSNTLFVYGLDN